MARRNNEPTSGSDKAKVRVFFAEVEGNNESVQEALKTMVSAMNRPTRVIQEQRPNGKAAAVLLEQTEDGEVEAEEALDQEEFEFEAESAPSNTRKARGTGKKIDRNSGLGLVPNLNFRPSGKLALKEFVEEKNPKNDLEAVMAVTYYMQHEMGLAARPRSRTVVAIISC